MHNETPTEDASTASAGLAQAGVSATVTGSDTGPDL